MQVRGRKAGRLRVEDLKEIRSGLDGYFEKWWEDQKLLWGDKKPQREPATGMLLDLLSCARGPLTKENIIDLAPPEANITK